MVEEDPVGGVHPVALAVVDGDPVGVELCRCVPRLRLRYAANGRGAASHMVMKSQGVSPRSRAGSGSSLQFLACYRGLRVKVRTAAARGTHRQFPLRSLTRTNSCGSRAQTGSDRWPSGFLPACQSGRNAFGAQGCIGEQQTQFATSPTIPHAICASSHGTVLPWTGWNLHLLSSVSYPSDRAIPADWQMPSAAWPSS